MSAPPSGDGRQQLEASAAPRLAGLIGTIVLVAALALPFGSIGSLFPQVAGPTPPPPSADPGTVVVGSPGPTPAEPPRIPAIATPPPVAVHTVPAAIDATGVVDVTDRLLAFFETVPDGATIRFAPGARYRIEGTLHLFDRHGLTFDGQGATFVALERGGDPDRAHWWIDRSTDIQLRDLTIQGAHPEPGTYVEDFEWQHAVQVYGGSDIEIGPGVTTTGNQGDGVYVARWADGVHVHDCTITRNGRMGVAVVAGRNVVVERCRLSDIAFSAFDVEPNEGTEPAEGADHITFRDNLIDGPVFSKFFAMSGFGPVSDVVVARNVVRGAGNNGIAVDARPVPGTPRRSDIAIVDNVGEGVLRDTDAVMHLWTIDGLTIVGNVQAVAGPGIVFARGDDWTDVRITGNDCPGCAG